MYRIGIDVGGTFTDLVAVDGEGRVVIAKSASTPEDPSIGVMDGIGLLAAELRQGSPGAPGGHRSHRPRNHGGDQRAPRTQGRQGRHAHHGRPPRHHRDARRAQGDRYNLRMPPPIPLAPRGRRLGVKERMRFDGKVATPLDRRSLEAAIARLKSLGVGSVAVCISLLRQREPREGDTPGARAPPARRLRVALGRGPAPDQGVRALRDYRRQCLCRPRAGDVSGAPRRAARGGRLRARGADHAVARRRGGHRRLGAARRGRGALGPPGGIAGSRHAARLLGHGDLITFDMGGTSTDIALLQNGEPQLTGDKTVGPSKVALPAIDIHTLGAGGGSIAYVDAGGILHVGPGERGRRAGTCLLRPGRNGGDGHRRQRGAGLPRPRQLWAAARDSTLRRQIARCPLSPSASARQPWPPRKASSAWSTPTWRRASARGCAAAPTRAASPSWPSAARRASRHRGRAHARDQSRCRRAGVAAVLSAWGMLATDLRHELVLTHVGEAQKVGGPRLRKLFKDMEAEGRRRLGADFRDRSASVMPWTCATASRPSRSPSRWRTSTWTPPTSWTRSSSASTAATRSSTPTACPARKRSWSTRALRSSACCRASPPSARAKPRAGPRRNPRAAAPISGAGSSFPVYDLDTRLRPGLEGQGPRNLRDPPTTTVVLRQDEHATVLPLGWLDIALR